MFAFTRIAVVAVAAATLVAGTAVPRTEGPSQCNTGSISCCNQMYDHKTAEHKTMSRLLGLDLAGSLIGAQCSPISIIPILGGNTCTSKPVCCQSNAAGGLINIGCVPISL